MGNIAKLSFASAALCAALACGGGGDDGPATRLSYTNPAPGGYRLEVSGGNGTGAVDLVLRGPSSVRARGANFGLGVDQAAARFVAKAGGDYAVPGDVFDLGAAPRIFRAALDEAGSVRVSMAQKGASVPARALSGDVASVSLRLQPGAPRGPVALAPLAAKVLLEDGSVADVQVSVGTLEAQ